MTQGLYKYNNVHSKLVSNDFCIPTVNNRVHYKFKKFNNISRKNATAKQFPNSKNKEQLKKDVRYRKYNMFNSFI